MRVLALVALTGALSRGLCAEDETPDELLVAARQAQRVLGDARAALAKYEEVLARPTLEVRQRAAALWGAAECRAALGEWPEAEEVWARILADPALPAEVRERAQEAKKKRAESQRTEPVPTAAPRSAAEEQAERAKRLEAEVETLLARAQAAFDARQYDDARQYALEALAKDEENARGKALLERVQQEQPDRGELLHALLKWFETVQSEAFQRLRTRLGEIEESGRKSQRAGDHAGADLAFRQAIAMLDRSEFRAQLEPERSNLVFWLTQVDTDGRAAGLSFPPAPAAPSGADAEVGLKARFYALLSETFAGRDVGADPIRFHEFAPRPTQDGLPHRSLGPNAFATRTVAVEQGPSTLTRARWAERWIRAHVGGDWPGPTAVRGARRPTAGAPTRLLERLEDVLFVQHTETVQREIDALRRSFDPRPPPLQVDVSVYAAGPGGTVRAAGALHLPPPPPREPGLTSVLAGSLIEECRRDLENLENLTLLGQAQLRFKGDAAARLDVTERTEAHPVFAKDGAPPLSILGLDPARYGLFLDVFAEDLPQAGRAQRAGALSLAARVRVPLPSVVVRKPDRGLDWTRLPKFAETTVECDERLPHAGTLLLFGLPNPFVDTAATHPDLVLLVGLRPAPADGRAAPPPDPPRSGAPAPPEAQDLPLGPLGTEVLDDVVMDGWPEDRSAAQPVADAVARRARDGYLAALLARRARLQPAEAAEAIVVRDGLASVRAGAAERVRLEEAAMFLAAQESALVAVDALCVEADAALADAWSRREGVVALDGGRAALVPAALAGALDLALQPRLREPTLFTLSQRQVTRATQQLVLRRLATQGTTRQMRVVRGVGDGAARFVPVPGLAEEGLVLQVRPELDDGGHRVVTVRARAARLRTIESLPLKDVPAGLSVDVPRWHPVEDRSVAAALADDDALLLRLAVPGDPAKVLLVRVRTRRIQ